MAKKPKNPAFRRNKKKNTSKPEPNKGLSSSNPANPFSEAKKGKIDPKFSKAPSPSEPNLFLSESDVSGLQKNKQNLHLKRNTLADLEPGIVEVNIQPKRKSNKIDVGFEKATRARSFSQDDMERFDLEDRASEKAENINTAKKKKIALSLRYQIPKKLKNLDRSMKEDVARWVDEQLRLAAQERDLFIQRLAHHRSAWNDFVTTGVSPTFDGAHDIHVPMTFEKVKIMHSRIYQAIFGIDPIFSIRPRKKLSEEQKQLKEDILSWGIESHSNKGNGWRDAIDRDIWNFVADGTAITKQFWTREVRKFQDVEEVEKQPLELDENGNIVTEEREVEREEIVHDCAMLEPVSLEDFYIIGEKSDSIDDADLIMHRQLFTKSELIRFSNLGFFDKEAVDKVLQTNPSSDSDGFRGTPHDQTTLKNQQEILTGMNRTGVAAGLPNYVIHESYLKFDIDEDGIDEDLVVWIDQGTNEVLRITYLDRVAPGGKRPFTIKRFMPREGSFYGLGMGEILSGLNNEIDMIHNFRLDYGLLQNLPFGFYRAASGLNPQDINLGPGKLIPVDDPQGDVFFPRMNGGTGYTFQEEQQVTGYADGASGVNDLTAGDTGSQGAARTATGAALLAQSQNAGIDIFIQRYQDGFKRNLNILDLQFRDLLPLGTTIRVLGMDGKDIYRQFTDRDQLRFEADYLLEGNSANSNKAIERDVALQIFQGMLNPIMLQTGLVQPNNIYNIAKNLLQKLEIRNIDAFLTQPENVQENPFTAREEISMIATGVRPPKTLNDDHQRKLAFYEQFENSDEFGLLEEEVLPLYQELKSFHEQSLQSIPANANNPAAQGLIGVNPELTAQIAAGSGAPNGVAQQQSDLLQQSSPANPEAGQ